MDDDRDDDEPTYDRAYLLQLLTEVRPDITLDDFRHYCNFPDDAVLADLLVAIQDAGEAAIYQDDWNPPVICLTPLGMGRAGVKLSQSHPPIWLRVDGLEPPIFSVQEAGFILFTDLDGEYEGETLEFVAAQVDDNQLEPVEVLTNVEALSEWLVLDRKLQNGQEHPKRSEFCLHGMNESWPLDQPRRATAATLSASTWQELYARCPFCRQHKPGEDCQVCHGQAPAKRCPVCDGKKYDFFDLCVWCYRSGVDHLLLPAEVAQARRKHVAPAKKAKKKKAKVKT